MRLFPHLLCRIGGDSFTHFGELINGNSLLATLSHITQLTQEKEAFKVILSAHLHEFIQTVTDGKTQNVLQNIRRDIYNNRQVKENAWQQAVLHLPTHLSHKAHDYFNLLAQLKAAQEKAETAYAQTIARERALLKELAQKEPLQKGLVLSSQIVLDNLPAYLNTSPEAYRKKELNLEISLLKYITRIYAKTSPFSTFTNLSTGNIQEVSEPFIELISSSTEEAVTGHVRMNNYLFKHLKDSLFTYKAAYWELPLRVNPTVKLTDNHYLFLSNYNNIESFQRIKSSPVLALFVRIAHQKGQALTFRNLLEEATRFIESDEQQIAHYLKQLIDLGLFEFNLGISGVDPDWDRKLVTKLAPLIHRQVPYAEELAELLVYMRTLRAEFALASATHRQTTLAEAHRAFKQVTLRLQKAAGWAEPIATDSIKKQALAAVDSDPYESSPRHSGSSRQDDTKGVTPIGGQYVIGFPFKPEQLFYEDTVRNVAIAVDERQLRALVEKIDTLCRNVPYLTSSEEQDSLEHFFLTKYGAQAQVSILTLYEDYFREVWKPKAESLTKKQPEHTANESVLESHPAELLGEDSLGRFTRERHAISRWSSAFQALTKAHELDVDNDWLLDEQLVQQTNQTLQNHYELEHSSSSGAFIQLFTQTESDGTHSLKGVLNSSFIGYGKMISRFLHVFDEAVTKDVRDWNQGQVKPDALFIENCDASHLNANLHPPLMPFEIWLPGSQNNLPINQQLLITEFNSCFRDGQLVLIHQPTGKRAYVFDLGFQGSVGRSHLFELLKKFSKPQEAGVYTVISSCNSLAQAKVLPQADEATSVIVLPRLAYEGQLILQRKTWWVPQALLPTREPLETNADFYYRVNVWRQAHAIPDEVFISVSTKRPNQASAGQGEKQSKDDYKPQYINFNSPLLVNLFEKLILKVSGALRIVEMLPNSNQLLAINQQKFVTEFLVQWYH